jgi:Domain of unknown function (DUF4258)
MVNKKYIGIIMLIVVIGARVAINFSNKKNRQAQRSNERLDNRQQKTSSPQEGGSFNDNEKEVNRHPEKIIYTKHAKCRMQCRNLDESEVQEILEKGKINFAKSNDRPGTCPTYALEGRTHDGQQSRMVFAFCNEREVKVITVIDLDTDWKCECE